MINKQSIQFIEEGHKYLAQKDGREIQLMSSTTFLKRYEKPFPKEFIAPKSAAKRIREGKTTATTGQEVIDMWSMSGDMAKHYGNAVHKAVEYWIKFEEYPKNDYLKRVVDAFRKLKIGPCAAEYVMGDIDLELGGMADIIQPIPGKPYCVNLLDIKTNADLYEVRGKLLPPFAHLDSNNFNKYKLQLNLYKYYLEKEGYKVYNMKLLHWVDDGFMEIVIDEEDLSTILEARSVEING